MNRSALLGLSSLVIVLLLPLFAWNGLVQQGNVSVFDIFLRLSSPREANSQRDLVLLAIDDDTAKRYGPLPINRAFLADALNRVADAGAKVLVVDLLLSEPTEHAADESLQKALSRFPKLLLGAALEAPRDGGPSRWILPLPEFQRSAFAIGHVHLEPDRDGVARTLLLAKSNGEERHWALAFEAFRASLNLSNPPTELARELRLGGRHIPATDLNGRLIWIHYVGQEGTFKSVSLANVLTGRAPPSDFAGKTVIVGVTAQGGGDRVYTPFSTGLGMSGIEIHANIYSTLSDGAFLTIISPVAELLWLLAIALLIIAAAWWNNGQLLTMTALCGVFAVPAFSYWMLKAGLIFPTVSGLTTAVTASLLCLLAQSNFFRRRLGEAVEGQQEYAFRLQAVAHEIKTPLTAIHASSQLISDDDVPERMKEEIAERIHKEAGRLSGVVTTFLDLERMAAGVLKLKKQPVELSGITDEACDRAALLAVKKNIAIKRDLQAVVVPADAELLQFAIYNLLSNAIKYSPSDSSVSVALRVNSREACLMVTDRGCGIDPAEHEKIFHRFYRSEQQSASAESGTGVGLALVKQIAVQHGGRVEVESALELGSTFRIYLPIEDQK